MATTVRGYVESSDASSGVEITLYDEDGAVRAIGENDRLEIYSTALSIANAAGKTTVFADTDDDNAIDSGEALLTVLPSTGAENFDRSHPGGLRCPKGAKPHVRTTGAGEVQAALTGVVRPSG